MPQPIPDYHYSELARALTMTPMEARMAILERKVDDLAVLVGALGERLDQVAPPH